MLAWICKNQLGRRNLTYEQRKYLIGKQYESEKASQGGNHGNQHTNLAKCQSGTLPAQIDTAARIAKENGIGRRSVFRAEAFSKAVDIADTVEPGIRNDLLAGKVKATESDIRELVSAEPEARPAIIEKIKAPVPKSAKRHERSAIRKIGDDMLHAQSPGNPETMLYEMNDALDSLIFRWSFCSQNYASFFDDEVCRGEINQIIQKGITYMKNCEGGKFTNEDDCTRV